MEVDSPASSTDLQSSPISSPPSIGDASKHRPPKAPREPKPEHCAICGRRSHGYHYEVPACNACKTFFRRALTASVDLKCITGKERCAELSEGSRMRCRWCRVLFCIEKGMNPLSIQVGSTFEDMPLFVKLRAKRQDAIPTDPINKLSTPPPTEDRGLMAELRFAEQHITCLRRSSWMPSCSTYEAPALNTLELLPFWPNECPELASLNKNWRNLDPIYAVEYLRMLGFFQTLDECEKAELSSSVSTRLANLSSAFFAVNGGADRLTYPDGTRPHWEGALNERAYHALMKPLRTLELSVDEYALLKAVVATGTTPSEATVAPQEPTVLERVRETYLAALREAAFSRSFELNESGPDRLARIISIIHLLFHQEYHQRMLEEHEALMGASAGTTRPEYR